MSLSGDDLVENLARVRDGIARAADRAGRDADGVTLVAAAKTVSPDLVRLAVEAGLHAVGHNYVQELREHRRALADLDVAWHFIGTLQSSTAHAVADLADVVETLAGERAIRRLAGRATRAERTVDALIEIDLTGGRSGVSPDELDAAVDLVASLEGVRLRGLMTLPPLTSSAEDARPWFRRLRELGERTRERRRDLRGDVLDLSMGMSLDYEVAVEEGATMVRVGSALFGARQL